MTSCQASVTPLDLDLNKIHPSRPTPIALVNVNWEVVDNNNEQVYYRLDENNFKLLKLFLLETSEYSNKVNSLLCYYRDDLNEVYCKDIISNSSPSLIPTISE